MTSTPPPKRFKSEPHSAIDNTMCVVPFQLDMPVPDGAMDDAPATAEEADNNAMVKSILRTHTWLLHMKENYRYDTKWCMAAIRSLATQMLPAIFNTSHDSLHDAYEKIIIENPWLVHKLFDAYGSGEYHKIQRLGMCRVRSSVRRD